MVSSDNNKIVALKNQIISKINGLIGTHNSSSSAHSDIRNNLINYGRVNSTSTSTVFTATVPNVNELTDGTTVMLRNGVVTSASGFTLNVNGLGAKPVYNSMADATRDTTIFNIAYTMLFVYDSSRISGGCWICYRGYDANTNTIGYQLRTNSTKYIATDKGYKYRLWLQTSEDGKFMPVNTSTSTNATANRSTAMNNREFIIGGDIRYYSTDGTTNQNAEMTATTMWQQYVFALGYSFNNTGSALALSIGKPVYMVATPTSNGKARLTTPYYTQDLPNSVDGKIYILLGYMYSATNIELTLEHPVFEYRNGSVGLYNPSYSINEIDTLLDEKADTEHTHGNLQNDGRVGTSNNTSKNVVTDSNGKITTEDKPTIPSASSTVPSADTSSGSYGSGTVYARSNHTHPKSSLYAEAIHNHTKSQITDLSIPSKTSDLTNDSNFISTSNTNGLIKNDGSIDTSSYITSSAITTHNSNASAHSSLFNGKANSIHTHSTSDITDLPAIPNNIEDLTLSTGTLQTDTGLDVVNYNDTTDTLYWGSGALSLDLGSDEVYYNSYEIATLNDIPSVPSASTTTPSADTTNGSYGSGTTYARSNHIHPKSSLYAEASHAHTKSQITNLYKYEISSSEYNPTIDSTITVYVKVTNGSNEGVANHTFTMETKNGDVSLTTDSNGQATHSYTCNTWGNQRFRVNGYSMYLNVTGWRIFVNNEAFTGYYNDDLVSLQVHITNTSVPQNSWTEWSPTPIPASNPDLRPHHTVFAPTNNVNTFVMVTNNSQKVSRTTSGNARTGTTVNATLIWKRK